MNLQIYKTTLSKSNQTAVPAWVINQMGLTAGDKLIWSIDPVYKTAKIKTLPRDWGSYLNGLGKDVWKGTNVEKYIKQGRKDRKII